MTLEEDYNYQVHVIRGLFLLQYSLNFLAAYKSPHPPDRKDSKEQALKHSV